MSSPKTDADTETQVVHSGFFGAGKSRSAAELAKSVPAIRPSKPSSSQSRRAATKTKKGRTTPLGPTPERLAKGDVDVRTGMHRAIPPIERLRDQGKLAPRTEDDIKKGGGLSFDPRENQALYEAALKLKRHYDGLGLNIKAQDLNKIVGGTSSDDLTKEEVWVDHRDTFKTAVKLMGWFDHNPLRGAGRLVVAVVCEEKGVHDAGRQYIGRADTTALMGAAMDRLREGLFALATHWRML